MRTDEELKLLLPNSLVVKAITTGESLEEAYSLYLLVGEEDALKYLGVVSAYVVSIAKPVLNSERTNSLFQGIVDGLNASARLNARKAKKISKTRKKRRKQRKWI